MSVEITTRLSKNGKKLYYYLEWGKEAGERVSTGKFTWTKPKDQLQRDYNKEINKLIEKQQAQKIIEFESIGTGHIPSHFRKQSFTQFYSDYVSKNASLTNRSLSCSFSQFQKFMKDQAVSFPEMTENLCERFRKHLLDNLTGETPADYFMRFKRVVKAAYKQGYFRVNVTEDLKARAHPTALKDVLDSEEYKRLINNYCPNHEVKKAAVISMYTGMRWCDVSKLHGWQVKNDSIIIKQSKTKECVEIPLHPVARLVIGKIEDPAKLVFKLPCANQANEVLRNWVWSAKIDKYITWHCLRHSVSDILQGSGIDVMTVAAMLGQTTAKHIFERYRKRVRQKDTVRAVNALPDSSTYETDNMREIILEFLSRPESLN